MKSSTYRKNVGGNAPSPHDLADDTPAPLAYVRLSSITDVLRHYVLLVKTTSSAPRPPAQRPAPHASRPTHAPRPAPPHLAPHASLPTLSGISPPLLLADSSSPRMTDDYPSFGDSSLFGANVYYRGTVALGRTGLIPAAHVYGGGSERSACLA